MKLIHLKSTKDDTALVVNYLKDLTKKAEEGKVLAVFIVHIDNEGFFTSGIAGSYRLADAVAAGQVLADRAMKDWDEE